jgi:hypothetical protein
LEEFESLASGVLNGDPAVSSANAASALAISAESEARSASDAVKAQVTKAAKLVQVFVDKFNAELSLLAQRIVTAPGVSSTAPSGSQESPSTLHLAGYHDRKTNRYTTGQSLREYDCLTRNGFVKLADFQTDSEASDWLRHSLPPLLTQGINSRLVLWRGELLPKFRF